MLCGNVLGIQLGVGSGVYAGTNLTEEGITTEDGTNHQVVVGVYVLYFVT
jgi:hypothetical protein